MKNSPIMKPIDISHLLLLTPEEQQMRVDRVRARMATDQLPAMLISDNANKYYLTGRVYAGYIYLPPEGPVIYFVRRPVELEGDGVVYIRKPEEIGRTVGLNVPEAIGLELDVLPYSTAMRLKSVFQQSELKNASAVMRRARAVKTAGEIEMIRRSGVKHVHVYSRIPHLYQPGMNDLELGGDRETQPSGRLPRPVPHQWRLDGALYGQRACGRQCRLPLALRFRNGRRGMDPSLPVGANGNTIKPGNTVMVDMNGNFDGYMTDMTRVFALGNIDPLALKAHQCSIDIHRELCAMMRPGAEAKALYAKAEEMVRECGLQPYFMGHRQHAGFIGHGIGIEINELPVIAPRSRDIIAAGNVIALEPKFVIPGTGAVGIENTYAVNDDGIECLTPAPEEISYFDV